MLRKKSKVIPEGNGPIPQDAYVMLSGVTLKDLRRIMSDAVDKAFDKHFGRKPENLEEMKATDQRSTSPEQATSRHGGRRHSRQEDSQAYRGR